MTWSHKLARPVTPTAHLALTTLADARAYMLALPKGVADQRAWQRGAELLLAAAESPSASAISAATMQLELALFLTHRQDMSKI